MEVNREVRRQWRVRDDETCNRRRKAKYRRSVCRLRWWHLLQVFPSESKNNEEDNQYWKPCNPFVPWKMVSGKSAYKKEWVPSEDRVTTEWQLRSGIESWVNDKETNLTKSEMITTMTIPALWIARRSASSDARYRSRVRRHSLPSEISVSHTG